MKRWSAIAAFGLAVLLRPPARAVEGAAGAVPEPAGAAYLEQVFGHLDEVHQRLKTLEVRVTQVKRSALLVEPTVSMGRLSYRVPDAIRWEYGPPDALTMLVTGGRLTLYYPELKKADVLDVGEAQSQIMRTTGLGQSSRTLRENFAVALAGRYVPGAAGAAGLLPAELALIPGSQPPATALGVLDLKPTRRRVQRRVSEVRLWISEANWLPLMIRLTESGGDTSLLVFGPPAENVELPPATFLLRLPADVQVNLRHESGPRGERE